MEIRRSIRIGFATLAATLMFPVLALAQGFMVKPMRMEAAPRAGQTLEIPLQIRNTAGEESRPIELRLVELDQSENGSWKIADEDAAANPASSLAWTTLSESRVEIAPLQPAEVMVRFNPPTTARGAYVAGIIAETPAPDEVSGLVVRMRFLIPVIVEIEGRSVRQEIALNDVAMNYHDGSDGKPATTTAHMIVVNDGQTFSRVRGRLSIERKKDERWRTVTRFEVRERSIIPGARLELGQDLEKRLPSGDYRLSGELFVDGRRIAPVTKEIAFEGDPTATLAYDAALLLDPVMVEMDIVPGATRTATLGIENPGSEPITVDLAASTPRTLVGVEMGTLKGQELSAQPWTTIQPAKFTIRPGGRQNVRVMSRVPREGVNHPNYYADLMLEGTYSDGQSAGETRSTIHLSFDGIESKPNGFVEQISIAEGETNSRYIVNLSFANVGNVHYEPEARVHLLTPQGVQLRNIALSGERSALLPLGRRTFSGELDLEGVEPGYYALRASVAGPGNMSFSEQEIVLVEAEDHGARVSIVDSSSGEVPEGLDQNAEEGSTPPPDEGQQDGGDAG